VEYCPVLAARPRKRATKAERGRGKRRRGGAERCRLDLRAPGNRGMAGGSLRGTGTGLDDHGLVYGP